jgi:hypothetical protein
VQVPGQDKPLAVKVGNLRALKVQGTADQVSMEAFREFTEGSSVEVHGLGSAPQYNGKRGVVRSVESPKGRYLVVLDGGKKINIKPANLSLLPVLEAQPEPQPDHDHIVICKST